MALSAKRRRFDRGVGAGPTIPVFEDPIPGFSLYLGSGVDTSCEEQVNDILLLIKKSEELFLQVSKPELEAVDLQHFMHVDFASLIRAAAPEIPDLSRRLLDTPSVTLSALSLALSRAVYCDLPDRGLSKTRTRLRLANIGEITGFRELKSNRVGQFVCIKGTVARVSAIKPVVTHLEFECSQCGGRMLVHLTDGIYKTPNRCLASSACRGTVFSPLRSISDSRTQSIDFQKIRLQEKLLDEKQPDSGRMPRTLECELQADLVGRVAPGDVVTLCGTVKLVVTEDTKFKRNNQTFVAYLDVNSILESSASASDPVYKFPCSVDDGDATASSASENRSASPQTGVSYLKDSLHFASHDLYAIQDIAMQPDLFTLLVHSLCPSIFGHELVKAGLLLALFGGRRRNLDPNGDVAVSMRSDSHVLIVGDPGLGKSQMLSSVVTVAPRGVYVCGNTATASGLTVTMVKDPDTGEFAVEAGALVLSDQGCCCIDEFDKMSEHQALLEAMEQQRVSIAKAGMVRSLPARTSLIAAANPVGGHYNKVKSVSENLRMAPALLSRFDLIFILVDKPDAEMDAFLSKHVLTLHSRSAAASNDREIQSASSLFAQSQALRESMFPLERSLKLGREKKLDVIPPGLLRKYIAYTRQFVHAVLSKPAAKVLQSFYLELRSKYRSLDGTPITNRQLESLIRLSEARARSECREEVTEQDAQEVIDLMKWSLWESYDDGRGGTDFSRSQHGK